MFESTDNNKPEDIISQTHEVLQDAPREDLENVLLYAKLVKIKRPWQRTLITITLNVLLFINPLMNWLDRVRSH